MMSVLRSVLAPLFSSSAPSTVRRAQRPQAMMTARMTGNSWKIFREDFFTLPSVQEGHGTEILTRYLEKSVSRAIVLITSGYSEG